MPDDALLAAAADGSLGTDAGFTTQLDRVFADPRTRDTIWQFWNEWLRFESFTGFSAERPAFKALAAGEKPGRRRPRPLGRHGAGDPRPHRPLHLDAAAGTFARSDDVDRVGHAVGRSRAPLRRAARGAAAATTRRFTDGSRAGHPAARGAAGVQPRADQPVPPRLAHPPVDPVRPPAAARSEQPAARIARSAAAQHRDDHAPALRGEGRRQRPVPGLPRVVQRTSATCMEAYDALGRFRTMEKVFDEQTGALLATLPIDTSASPQVIAGDMRAGERPGRAEPAHRSRAARSRPACRRNYFRFALRRDPTARQRRRVRVRGDARRASRRAIALADVFRGVAADTSFRRHERWARHETTRFRRRTCPRRAVLTGAGGAVLALPFLESLLPRSARRPDSDAAQAVHRAQVVQHAAGPGVVPALHRQRLRAEGQQVLGLSKADGTTLLTQKLVAGKNYTWAPLADFQTVDRHLRHPRARR